MNKKICPKILGVVLISIIINLTLTSKAIAATYYVDSTDGLDTNNGTSESTPWQTINKVNTSTFNPGDNVLFKKDRIWREQLTVPSSGTNGNVITFGSYGSGNNPRLIKSDVYTNWWEHSMIVNGSLEVFTGTRDDDISDTFDTGWNMLPSPGDVTEAVSTANTGLTSVRINKNEADSYGSWIRTSVAVTGNTTYYIEYWGKKDTTAYGKMAIKDVANNLILQDDGSWNASANYLESIETTGTTWEKKSLVFTTDTVTTALDIRFHNYIGVGNIDTGLGSFYIDDLYLIQGATKRSAKVWAGYINGIETSWGLLDGNIRVPQIYRYDTSNQLDIDNDRFFSKIRANYFHYRKDDAYPSGTQVGVREYGILVLDKQYIIIDGIDVYGPGGTGSSSGDVYAGISINGSSNNVQVKNLDVSYLGTDSVGIWAQSTTDAILYDNITAHDNGSTGIYVNSNGGTVRNSKSYNNGKVLLDQGDRGGIAGFQAQNLLIENNEVYNNGQTNQNADYELSFVEVAGITIKNNYAHDCIHGCIQVANSTNNAVIAYNVVDGFGTARTAGGETSGSHSGIRIGDVHGTKVYNNVIANGTYDPNPGSSSRAGVFIWKAGGYNEIIKNNVFYNNVGIPDIRLNYDGSATGHEIDNNVYSKSDYTNNWYWLGTNYSSLSAWNTARGFDTNSSTNNPDFVNVGSSDYRLKSTSWGIDRGIDVGLLLDKNGVTVPQGEGVDIGAYELSGSFSEVGTTDDAKDNGIKLRSPKKDEYKNDKTPKFRFRKMDDSSIEKYQVLVKEKKSGKEYVYIDDITPNGGKKEEDDNKKVWYKNDEIEVESKTKLKNMEYKWWVKAKNNLEQLNKSEERKLHIDTTKPQTTITKAKSSILGVMSEKGIIVLKDVNNIEICKIEIKDDKNWICKNVKPKFIEAFDLANNKTFYVY